MAATGELKERIQLLQAAKARAEALGKALKPEALAELESYSKQGLLGSSATGAAGGKVTEGERKTAFLATRLAGAMQQINGASKDAQSPGFASLIGGTGNVVGNLLTGSDRQRVENAQLDLLDSALTLGTGAAYTKEQLQGYRQSYFPQIGDAEATVADKKRRLALALQAARIGAGGAAPQIDDALKAAGFAVPDDKKGGDQPSTAAGAVADGSGAPPPPGSPPQQNADAGGTVQFAGEGPQMQANSMRLTDEQFQTFQNAAMSGASAEELKGMATAFGRAPDAAGLENLKQVADFYANPANRKTPLGIDYKRDEVKPVDAGDGALGAAARGAGNTLTFGGLDEVGALADTVTTGGTYADNLDTRRGQELFDEQQNGGSRLLGQVVGGLPIGGLEFMGARQAARAAGVAAVRAGRGAEEARVVANRVFAARTAIEAAGLGGAYGFGDADGGLGNRVVGAGIGAGVSGVLGGAAALAGGRFARAMASRGGPRPPTDGQEVLAAAQRQNIVPFPADVGGGAVRRATSATAQTIAGAQPIIAGAQRTVASAQAVRDRVANAIGAPVGAELAGETARAGAQAFIARTGQRIGRIYDAAAAAGGSARVQPVEAIRVLDQELGPLRESPIQGPSVAILEGLRDALSQPQTVRGLREARTQLRDQFESSGLRGSNVERIAGRVVDAATDDLVNGLRTQGLDAAARQYRVADRMWAERAATIDDTLEPILGNANNPKSGEQIVQGLKTAMAGNNRRFAGFVNALPPEEQSTVRASLIQRMGRATKGQQDDEGEVFSLGTFLTNWNEIGERAKNTLFGAEGRTALNDLARYAAGSKEAQRFANFSNTGGAVGNLATVASGVAGIKTLGSALVVQYGAGRLLASPRFARWLARAPQNASSAPAYIERLSRVARAEPAIASDVLAIQQRLTDAFGSTPARLAADERRDRSTAVDRQDSQGATANQRLQP